MSSSPFAEAPKSTLVVQIQLDRADPRRARLGAHQGQLTESYGSGRWPHATETPARQLKEQERHLVQQVCAGSLALACHGCFAAFVHPLDNVGSSPSLVSFLRQGILLG